MAVEDNAIAERRPQPVPEEIAQVLHGGHTPPILCQLARLAETGRQQSALCAGAPAAFVSGTMDQGLDGNPAANIERADFLRGVDLMAGDGKQIDTELIYIRRNLPDGLRRVRMQKDAMRVGDCCDFGDRLNGADLVVGVHDADQKRVASDRLADVVGVNQTAAVYGDIGYRRAQPLKEPAWLEDRGMLDLRCDDVRRTIAAPEEETLEGKIVRLAPAAGKNDLRRGAAKERSDQRT